ncbi:Cep3p NDAI_0H03240 [Naumovozyma dairenensis CBS 421]|uniref:Zn(2)-C6 fungal-type domain-containing protein n=1 Tax=Naumovozyma dairenensis (strain ATCC 10597 / BCRC 20456 / CBS 421 / NBRC 0211 / NRRL Y-12639) TaxID=1071378 RepID=G0WFD6_NAUDC|nr:hypothetical protein NDAI_0H03240 [Naumovozyma dairenensis CBS 421]CCD26497.1 hypothetical protein NDAI_0H03240 [Naumovozyma dairenensis CBS 421]
MLHWSTKETKKTTYACSVCKRKKTKCDKLIPCTSCVQKGLEAECLTSATANYTSKLGERSSEYLPTLLELWQSYEYWIMDIGLLKTKNINTLKKTVDMIADLNECDFWMKLLNMEASFKLLNFAMEQLGALHFGCLGELADLYPQLEHYWRRREEAEESETHIFLTSDNYYSNALLWAFFTISVYYMPLDQLAKLFDSKSVCKWLEVNPLDEWTEQLSYELFRGFTNTTIMQLNKAKFMMYPDIRLLQTYIILNSTSFTFSDHILVDSLIIQCMNVAKLFSIDFYKPFNDDDEATEISKNRFAKIWYLLCIADYLQSGPSKLISFHSEIPSLFLQPSFFEFNSSTDIFHEDSNFELMCWKIISLDRDIDKYLNQVAKPRMGTLDNIRKELAKVEKQISLKQKKEKTSRSTLEKFITTFLINSVFWKIHKAYLVYYQVEQSLSVSIHYTKTLIALLVKNVTEGNSIFNKHPYVFRIISRIAPFYEFYSIFQQTDQILQIKADLNELISTFSLMFGEKINNLLFILDRLHGLEILWTRVQVIGSGLTAIHPVFKILQNDMKFINRYNRRVPMVIKGTGNIAPRNRYNTGEDESIKNFDEDEANFKVAALETEEFKMIVSTFENEYNIDNLIT